MAGGGCSGCPEPRPADGDRDPLDLDANVDTVRLVASVVICIQTSSPASGRSRAQASAVHELEARGRPRHGHVDDLPGARVEEHPLHPGQGLVRVDDELTRRRPSIAGVEPVVPGQLRRPGVGQRVAEVVVVDDDGHDHVGAATVPPVLGGGLVVGSAAGQCGLRWNGRRHSADSSAPTMSAVSTVDSPSRSAR